MAGIANQAVVDAHRLTQVLRRSGTLWNLLIRQLFAW